MNGLAEEMVACRCYKAAALEEERGTLPCAAAAG